MEKEVFTIKAFRNDVLVYSKTFEGRRDEADSWYYELLLAASYGEYDRIEMVLPEGQF